MPEEAAADSGTHWLSEPDQQIWRAYILGSQMLQDRLDRDLRVEHGLSLTEYEILVRLSEQPDRRMRMALLADSVCHSRSRVTHTVARMEKQGLIARTAVADDGRGIEAALTDDGMAVLERAAHTHVRGVRRNLVDIVDADDYAALGRVMNAVSDRLLVNHSPAADIRSHA